eukprot:1839178-Karenia_brevis.AAC.1
MAERMSAMMTRMMMKMPNPLIVVYNEGMSISDPPDDDDDFDDAGDDGYDDDADGDDDGGDDD